MRCINCGIAMQRLQRHLISSLSAHHQTRLSRWITNAQTQLPLETFICHSCFLLLSTEAGEHGRLLGHNMVCLGCGKSMRKIRHHNVSIDCPLLAVLLSQNTNYVGLDHDDANSDFEDMPGTSSQNMKRDISSWGNEIKVFCPKCNTEVPHTAEGIQEMPRYKTFGKSSRKRVLASRRNLEQGRRVSEGSRNTRGTSEMYPEGFDQSGSSTPYENNWETCYKRDISSWGNEIKVFCPKCNTEVPHTAEGIQEDQTKILVAKVYHYFEQEYEELKKMYGDLDLTPLSRFRQRTALATGVSETTVLQILNEEQERNAEKRQEPPKKRRLAAKRSRQMDSSSEEDNSDDNVDDGGQASFTQIKKKQLASNPSADEPSEKTFHEAQKDPEIETLVVKIEPPEYYKDQPQTDPILVEVKAEPPDDDLNNTNETLAQNEPAGTKRKGRKIPRTDVTPTQQHPQGESSTRAAASSVRLTEELHQSDLSGGSEVKLEKIEIEEGFS